MRAFKRGQIELVYSQGFHPKPKVSFEDPLPIGVESEQETVYLTVPAHVRPEEIHDALNEQLPEGLKIIDAQRWPYKRKPDENANTTYAITLSSGQLDPNVLVRFMAQTEFVITKRSHKGKHKHIDIKELIVDIKLVDAQNLVLILRRETGKSIRPNDVLAHLFELNNETILTARILKKASEVE